VHLRPGCWLQLLRGWWLPPLNLCVVYQIWYTLLAPLSLLGLTMPGGRFCFMLQGRNMESMSMTDTIYWVRHKRLTLIYRLAKLLCWFRTGGQHLHRRRNYHPVDDPDWYANGNYEIHVTCWDCPTVVSVSPARDGV